MNNPTLTNENYFSKKHNIDYMGSTQFKHFMKCEAEAMAELKGECEKGTSTALLVGSYVDAHFEGTLDIFKAHHPEIFTKSGDLKSDYQLAEVMIQRAERDPKFMQYMSGEKQKIFTGEIAGVPYKIKVDSYHEGNCIVDLKCMKDFKPVWDEDEGMRKHFIMAWGYHYQAAIYTEIVRQNTGKRLPFYIAAISKEREKGPKLKLYFIPDEIIDSALEEIKSLSPRFQRIKNGELIPQRCGDCKYCRHTEVLEGPVNFLEEIEEVYEVE